MTTLITNTDGTTYRTTINQVVFKGCDIKPIGKTGYFSEKVPASGPSQGSKVSTAPAVYRLRDKDNKVINHFLSMKNLKAFLQRNDMVAINANKKTASQA